MRCDKISKFLINQAWIFGCLISRHFQDKKCNNILHNIILNNLPSTDTNGMLNVFDDDVGLTAVFSLLWAAVVLGRNLVGRVSSKKVFSNENVYIDF